MYGLYLSFYVRNNPSLFNESKVILGIITQLGTFGGLIILLSKALLSNPDTVAIIESLGYLGVSTVVLVALFFPKIYHMYLKPHKTTESSFNLRVENRQFTDYSKKQSVDNSSSNRDLLQQTNEPLNIPQNYKIVARPSQSVPQSQEMAAKNSTTS